MTRKGFGPQVLPRILGLVPKDANGFCEPFGFSPEVWMNLPPSSLEAANDREGNAVALFRATRERADDFGACLARHECKYCRRASARADGALCATFARERGVFDAAAAGIGALGARSLAGTWEATMRKKTTRLPGYTRFEKKWAARVPHLRNVLFRLKLIQYDDRRPDEMLQSYKGDKMLFFVAPRGAEAGGALGDTLLAKDSPCLVLLGLGAQRMSVPAIALASRLTEAGWRAPDLSSGRWRAFANYPADTAGLL